MNKSSNGRLKGIYERGKKFWFRYSVDGHQTRVPLDTADEGEAVTRALKIRGNPLLAADPLAEELESFLAEKLEDGTYTSASVESRRAVLKCWMAERHLKEVRQVREDEMRLWLRSLRKGKDALAGPTNDSYLAQTNSVKHWLTASRIT